jgi:hypothetical protein
MSCGARHLALFSVLVLVLAGAGCHTPRLPDPAQELGFRSPEQTFRTFQAALAHDRIDVEYRCLGADFKRANGLSQLGYRAFREELLASEPALRRLAGARIVESRPLGEDRWWLLARVKVLWRRVDVAVELVREDFAEAWVGDERRWDDALDWAGVISVEHDPSRWPPRLLTAHLPLEEGLDPATWSELRFGREWKIDGLEPVAP